MPTPKVSIAIPTKNRCALLGLTIHSLLQQSYRNFEVVVSDNCSTDDTAQMVKNLGIRNVHLRRAPHPLSVEDNTLNAVQGCQGEYLLILSDDDLLMPDYLGHMVAAFDRDAQVRVGLGRRVLIDAGSKPFFVAPPRASENLPGLGYLLDFFNQDLTQQVNTMFSCFFRRTEWLEVGGLPRLPAAFYADLFPFIELGLRGSIAYRSEALFCYRTHAAGATASTALDLWQTGPAAFWAELQRRASYLSGLAGPEWATLESCLGRFIAEQCRLKISSADIPEEEKALRLSECWRAPTADGAPAVLA